MVGDALLVQPVSAPEVASVVVRLPASPETYWYDLSGEGVPPPQSESGAS